LEKHNLFFIYLDIIAPVVIFLVVLFAVVYRGLKLLPYDRILISFLLSQIILNSLGNYLQDLRINNQWVYHLNCITTQGIFTFYFCYLFADASKKRLLLYGSLIFILFYVINIIFIQPYYTFASYSYAMGAFLFVGFALMSFYGWMEGLPATNILLLKEFWGAAGILFYFGSSFFIFISYEYLSEVSPRNVGTLWKLHNVFLTLGCLIFLKAIFSKQWIPKSSS
jgi:hypothetical protein